MADLRIRAIKQETTQRINELVAPRLERQFGLLADSVWVFRHGDRDNNSIGLNEDLGIRTRFSYTEFWDRCTGESRASDAVKLSYEEVPRSQKILTKLLQKVRPGTTDTAETSSFLGTVFTTKIHVSADEFREITSQLRCETEYLNLVKDEAVRVAAAQPGLAVANAILKKALPKNSTVLAVYPPDENEPEADRSVDVWVTRSKTSIWGILSRKSPLQYEKEKARKTSQKVAKLLGAEIVEIERSTPSPKEMKISIKGAAAELLLHKIEDGLAHPEQMPTQQHKRLGLF
jgi:hypothetical protein